MTDMTEEKANPYVQLVGAKHKKSERIPIYEKLEPNACLIISRSDSDLLVACNNKGKIELKRVPIPKEASIPK